MADLLIRPLARDDHDRWRPLWDGYNAFYGRAGDTALDPAVTAMTWSRIFDAHEPVHGLVAERDGALLGLTHYLFHRSTTAIEPTCYLQDLFTTEAARGQGVGRALIAAVYEAAQAAGASRVYWQTHETNVTVLEVAARHLPLAEESHPFISRRDDPRSVQVTQGPRSAPPRRGWPSASP